MSETAKAQGIPMGEYTLKAGAEKQVFETGARRDAQLGKGRFDLIPLYPMARLAKIYEAGAVKYDPDNWLKGMPLSRFVDSTLRHLLKWSIGAQDEDHLGQALWNLWGLMTTEALIRVKVLPESLRDMPNERWKPLVEEVLRMLEPPARPSPAPEAPKAAAA